VTVPHQLTWEEKGVVASFSGALTLKECNRANTDVYSDPRCDGLRYVIWDLSGVREQLMTPSESQVIAMVDKVVGSRLKHLKMAFVAAEETSRLICGQYAVHAITYGIPWQFVAFDTLEEARRWCVS
jgi:hypothetical protein